LEEENEWQYLKRKTLPLAIIMGIFITYLMYDFMKTANTIQDLALGAFLTFSAIITTWAIWVSRQKTTN